MRTIDPYHSAAMMSLGGIKSFVLVWQALARREFSAWLSVKNKACYSSETQHGRRVKKVYLGLKCMTLSIYI